MIDRYRLLVCDRLEVGDFSVCWNLVNSVVLQFSVDMMELEIAAERAAEKAKEDVRAAAQKQRIEQSVVGIHP